MAAGSSTAVSAAAGKCRSSPTFHKVVEELQNIRERKASRRVNTAARIIQAIREAVMPEHALAGGKVDVGGNKAAGRGIVITALQIIPAGSSS